MLVLNQYCSQVPFKILFQQHRPQAEVRSDKVATTVVRVNYRAWGIRRGPTKCLSHFQRAVRSRESHGLFWFPVPPAFVTLPNALCYDCGSAEADFECVDDENYQNYFAGVVED